MTQFENPIQFNIKKQVNGAEIVYSDLIEIVQGGPEIGTISINGRPIPFYRFGGPFLHKDDYIFIPVYVKKIFTSGFKLAKVNIQTSNVELLGKTKDLIYLDKLEGNRIFFYEDLQKTVSNHYDLSIV
jgi:hypothetical protein